MIHHLLHVGLSHHTSPVSVRETCAANGEQVMTMLATLQPLADEVAVLSTCSRFELYISSAAHDVDTWVGAVADLQQCPPDRLRAHVHSNSGAVAARHLLRVASGLDSQIIGEDHIAQQVRQAFELARRGSTCGPTLSAVFRAAIHAGRRVRRMAPLNRIPRSFAHLAAEHYHQHGTAGPRRLLILGSGFLAHEVARALKPTANDELTVIGRNLDRARLLADQVNSRAAVLEALPALCRTADAVFACTAAPRYLINPTHIGGDDRIQHLYDLGMPRNIDPVVGCAAGVELLHLEDLAPHRSERDATLQVAERTVNHELDKLLGWFQRRAGATGRPTTTADCQEGLAA